MKLVVLYPATSQQLPYFLSLCHSHLVCLEQLSRVASSGQPVEPKLSTTTRAATLPAPPARGCGHGCVCVQCDCPDLLMSAPAVVPSLETDSSLQMDTEHLQSLIRCKIQWALSNTTPVLDASQSTSTAPNLTTSSSSSVSSSGQLLEYIHCFMIYITLALSF